MRRIWVFAVVAMLLVCYSFIGTYPENEKNANQKRSEENVAPALVDAANNSSIKSDFDTQEKLSIAPGVEDPFNVMSVSDAIIGMTVPKKAVRLIFEDYNKMNNPSLSEKMELMSALSFCDSRRNISEIIGSKRSQGKSSYDEMQLINSAHSAYVEYCSDLSETAYFKRRDILETLAAQGNAEARTMYFDVGPIGRWPQDNEYLSISKEQIGQWVNQSVDYLKQSAQEGDYQAYKTLATIYGSRSDDPVLGSSANMVDAYTYNYLWGISIAANPATSPELKQALNSYLVKTASKLTSEQQELARKNAISIHSKSRPN